MYLKPSGTVRLEKDVLKEDSRHRLKVGQAGLGKKAVYLGRTYIPYTCIERIYKRVAISKGGFTGKGIFASLPYLVVETREGKTHVRRFKFEHEVDAVLLHMKETHPQIPRHSLIAEKKLLEEAMEEEKRFLKELSPEATSAVERLREAQRRLEEKPVYASNLSETAKTQRMIRRTNPFYRPLQAGLIVAAVITFLLGLYTWKKGADWTTYFILMAFSAILIRISVRVSPAGKDNKLRAEKEFSDAIQAMKDFLGQDAICGVPARYAHPATLERMIRIIREGRAESEEEAFVCLKKDLKALDASVTVSRRDYEEIIAIKPMFLSHEYK